MSERNQRLFNYLESSEDYNEVGFDVRENPFTVGLYQNVLDRDKNTVITIRVVESQEENSYLFSTKLYFEIDDTPYWFTSYVETPKEVRKFEKSCAELIVNMVNQYNDF